MQRIKTEPSSTDAPWPLHPNPNTSTHPFALLASTPAPCNSSPDHKPSSKLSKSRRGRFLSLSERNAEFACQIGLKRTAEDTLSSKYKTKHTIAKKPKTVAPVKSGAESTKSSDDTRASLLPLLDLVAPYMTFQIALANLSGVSKRDA